MQKVKNTLKELVTIAILSVVIVLPIRIFIAQPFIVSGASMDNTFYNGNYLIIDEISYRVETPKRGEVIIFQAPPKALELQHYDLSKKIFYIKRIVGLPGETVEINGDETKIYNDENPDGFALKEPYAYVDKNIISSFSDIHEKITLGADEYFVMGDNRHNSSDSRIWGVLKKGYVKGRVFLRLFPFNQVSVFPGDNIMY